MSDYKKKSKEVLNEMGFKTDANETAVVSKQLEVVQQQTYDIKFAEFRGREFIPVNSSIPEAADTFVYQQWDHNGSAEFIANGADDYPKVDALKNEFIHRMKDIGDNYSYSKQDLLQAAVFGTSLDVRRAMSARRAMERKIDDLMVRGDADQGYKGLANHPNVTVLTAPAAAGGGFSADWSDLDKTPLEILNDMHTICNQIDNIEDGFFCDTLLLDTPNYNLIKSTSMSTDNTESILSTFLKQSNAGFQVAPWQQLRLEDAAGTGPRMIAYKRDPEVVEFYIAKEYTEEAPELHARNFQIYASARVGGTVVRYPLAIAYMDGI